MKGALLSALRDATAAQHREVERLVPLSRTPLRRQDYVAYLVAMGGFHPPLEAQLYGAHDWAGLGLPDADARRRTALLAADLRALDIDPAAVPRCPALPSAGALGEALGCFYVLEGSTLGGQVLAREVAGAFTEPVPTAYLVGAGEETGRRWVAFCRFAEGLAAGDAALPAQAIAGALATFGALAGWLSASPQ